MRRKIFILQIELTSLGTFTPSGGRRTIGVRGGLFPPKERQLASLIISFRLPSSFPLAHSRSSPRQSVASPPLPPGWLASLQKHISWLLYYKSNLVHIWHSWEIFKGDATTTTRAVSGSAT